MSAGGRGGRSGGRGIGSWREEVGHAKPRARTIILRAGVRSVILRSFIRGAMVTPLMTTVKKTQITVMKTTIDGWSRQLSETELWVEMSLWTTCLPQPHMLASYMVCWMASASARPTEPRRPPHHMTTASCHVQPVPKRESNG